MSNDNIMKGYKGVMDLDLSTIDPKFHKELRQQHQENIEEYKTYQHSLPSKLRYENSTAKAMQILKLDKEAARLEGLKREQAQNEKDKIYIDRYYRVQKILSERKKH